MSDKIAIHSKDAPPAGGPYSPAIKMGNMVFTAGQVGLVPATNQFVEGGIEEQTRQVLTNIQAVLTAAGATMGDVVKTTVFLKDMNDFTAMNGVYATFFGDTPPARSTVQVARLPLDALVEIETIAVIS
ncbi:MAG TPA: RidA family protein [Phototrophicaceae bacterium]|jgi:2-iminobutanoate/2-iminopropanoate deaminase|nr:RidA family protein [Phototrophicaceae bacterium]